MAHIRYLSCKPVVQHSVPLAVDQLVAVTQYHRERLGSPLAVGRMAVTSDTLREADEKDTKGKAVYVLHTWKDSLWDMGVSSKMDVPEPREIPKPAAEETSVGEQEGDKTDAEGEMLADDTAKLQLDDAAQPDDRSEAPTEIAPESESAEQPAVTVLSPEVILYFKSALSQVLILEYLDVSGCLRSALLQALQTTLSSLPPSAFPITASTFWSNNVLPARPAQPLGAGVPIGESSHVGHLIGLMTVYQISAQWTSSSRRTRR